MGSCLPDFFHFEVMRSLQKVWARTRARNTLFPKEMLFFEFNSYFEFCLFHKISYVPKHFFKVISEIWFKLRPVGYQNKAVASSWQYCQRGQESIWESNTSGTYTSRNFWNLVCGPPTGGPHTWGRRWNIQFGNSCSERSSSFKCSNPERHPSTGWWKVGASLPFQRSILGNRNCWSSVLTVTMYGFKIVWCIPKRNMYFQFFNQYLLRDSFSTDQFSICSKVRDWVSIMPDAVTFKNCFKARKLIHDPDGTDDPRRPLPQMFTFLPRASLPNGGEGLDLTDRQPRQWRGQGSKNDDIFCLVKETITSRSLCQPPLLVFPAALVPASEKFLSDANDAQCPLKTYQLDGDRWEELRLIRFALKHDFPHMHRAIAWYEQLLRNPCPVPSFGQVPQLSFLRHASAHQQDWHALELGSRPLARKPYELEVVFHRGRH